MLRTGASRISLPNEYSEGKAASGLAAGSILKVRLLQAVPKNVLYGCGTCNLKSVKPRQQASGTHHLLPSPHRMEKEGEDGPTDRLVSYVETLLTKVLR